MPQFNHKAIWAMVALQQVLGFVWYSPPLFLNLWLEGIGKKQSDLNQSDPVPFIAAIVGAIAFCYILAWVNDKAKAETTRDGALVGGLMWLGLSRAGAGHPLQVHRPVVAGDRRGRGQGTRRRRPHRRHPGGLEEIAACPHSS